jgi:hypothetical protein
VLHKTHSLVEIYHPIDPADDRKLLARPQHAKNHRRAKTNFARRFNLIWVVQSASEKYSALLQPQLSGFISFIPHPKEGRFAIVTNVGRGMRWTR